MKKLTLTAIASTLAVASSFAFAAPTPCTGADLSVCNDISPASVNVIITPDVPAVVVPVVPPMPPKHPVPPMAQPRPPMPVPQYQPQPEPRRPFDWRAWQHDAAQLTAPAPIGHPAPDSHRQNPSNPGNFGGMNKAPHGAQFNHDHGHHDHGFHGEHGFNGPHDFHGHDHGPHGMHPGEGPQAAS